MASTNTHQFFFSLSCQAVCHLVQLLEGRWLAIIVFSFSTITKEMSAFDS